MRMQMTENEAIKLLLNIRKLTGRKSGERIAVDMAIEALLRVSRMDEEKTGNDTDRTTDDQCGDGAKMIALKKRTITERLIIANSLIASAIADSDKMVDQFCDEMKKTDDVY